MTTARPGRDDPFEPWPDRPVVATLRRCPHGLHAVGSTATVKKRTGRLVATSKRTGRLPDNIIARAPDASRLGGKPAGASVRTKDADQVVPVGGLTVSDTLPAAGVTTSSTAFTTTKAGRLLVDYTGTGQLQCPTSSFVRWWVQVDGVPIKSSSVQLGEAVAIAFDYNGFPAIRLSGVTAEVVAPGNHSLSLAGGCISGVSGGSGQSGTGAGTVTVLSSGVVAPAGTRPAKLPKACVTTAAGRSCR